MNRIFRHLSRPSIGLTRSLSTVAQTTTPLPFRAQTDQLLHFKQAVDLNRPAQAWKSYKKLTQSGNLHLLGNEDYQHLLSLLKSGRTLFDKRYSTRATHLAKLWKAMLENHVKPSPPLAVAFAEAFARFGTAEQFADVLSWMQASKYPLSDQKLKESILLSAATAGDSEKVESVFQELQKGSTKSPIGYLNWILMGYARGRHEQLLLDTFNRMESLGCRPDGNSFYHVLTYYAALGNTTKLKEWLAKMKEAGVTPSIPTYSTVLHGCFAAQDYDLAQEIVQEVEAEGRPVDYHFKALQARLAARTGDFKGALKQLNGIEGNSRASSPILWGDVAKALGPIKPSMTKTELEDVTGTILSHKALQNLISGYNHIKDPASAQAITNWIK